MAELQVGKQYVIGRVVGAGLAPLQCNPAPHPCRVTVVKLGRKYAHVPMTGCSKPVPVNPEQLWEIDEAKASYRAGLEARDAMWRRTGHADACLGPHRIDQLVEEL